MSLTKEGFFNNFKNKNGKIKKLNFALDFVNCNNIDNKLLDSSLFKINCFDDFGYYIESKFDFVENSNIMKVELLLTKTISKFFTLDIKYCDVLLPMCPYTVDLMKIENSQDLIPSIFDSSINLDNVNIVPNYPLTVAMISHDPPQSLNILDNIKKPENYCLKTKFKVKLKQEKKELSNIEELENLFVTLEKKNLYYGELSSIKIDISKVNIENLLIICHSKFRTYLMFEEIDSTMLEVFYVIEGDGKVKFEIGANNQIIKSKEINIEIEKCSDINKEEKFYLSLGQVENTAINSCLKELKIHLTNDMDNSEKKLFTDKNLLKSVENTQSNKIGKYGEVFMKKDGISLAFFKNSNTDELLQNYNLKKNYFIKAVPFDYKWCNVHLCKNNDGVIIKSSNGEYQFCVKLKNSNSDPNFVIFPNKCLLLKYTVSDEPISGKCHEIIYC